MIVFSPLALYTTFLGWQQYDVIYSALWQTGVLFFGFLVLAWRFLSNVLVQANPHQGADHALHQFLFDLAKMFFICILFVYPSTPLEQKGLSFKPMCTLDGVAVKKESKISDTGTSYDEDFAHVLSDDVRVPLGFALLQNFTSSLTYGLMKVTGCTDSLQSIKGDLISTHIPHDLRTQAIDFHQQCFLEARNLYLHQPLSDANKIKAKKILKEYGGENDLNWLGSKVLQTFYYDTLKARSPVPGFKYVDNKGENFENAAKEDKSIETRKPENGFPTCQKWWDKLKADLVDASDKASILDEHLGRISVVNRVAKYKTDHRITWKSKLTTEDFISRVLLDDGDGLQIQSSQALVDENNTALGNTLARGLVNSGQWVKSVTSTPLKREATMQSLPIMQAFFYFFLIVITAFVLPLSAYSPRAVGSLCALFFMAILIQYLWHLGSYLERATVNNLGENNVVSVMQNTMLLFYYIAPIILLKLSSHFGGEGGAALSNWIDQGDKASESVANSGKDTGLLAAKVASKGLSK